MRQLFRRKSVADCDIDIAERGGLKRTLNKWHLTALGVGATIGAGIFATTGTAIVGDPARPGAGPAIVLSLTKGSTFSPASSRPRRMRAIDGAVAYRP